MVEAFWRGRGGLTTEEEEEEDTPNTILTLMEAKKLNNNTISWWAEKVEVKRRIGSGGGEKRSLIKKGDCESGTSLLLGTRFFPSIEKIRFRTSSDDGNPSKTKKRSNLRDERRTLSLTFFSRKLRYYHLRLPFSPSAALSIT